MAVGGITEVARRVIRAPDRLRDPAVRVDVAVGHRALEALEGDWQRLWELQAHALPCQTWKSVLVSQELSAGTGCRPVIVVVREGGLATGMLALQASSRWGVQKLEWLGQGALPRHAPLVSPRREAPPVAAFDLLRAALLRLGARAILRLERMAPASSAAAWLRGGLDQVSDWKEIPGRVDVMVDLRGGWDRLAASLTRGFRQRALSADRRLHGAAGGVRILRIESPSHAELAAMIDGTAGPDGPDPGARTFALAAADAALTGAWLAVEEGVPRAVSAVWTHRRRAVEIWAATRDDELRSRQVMDVLRLHQLQHLSASDALDELVLFPGHGADLVAVPSHQFSLQGALGSLPFRLAARYLLG